MQLSALAPVMRAGGRATSPMNCTTLQTWGQTSRDGQAKSGRSQGIAHAMLPHAALFQHSLGVAHATHHPRFGLQFAHHSVRQLHLAAGDVVCRHRAAFNSKLPAFCVHATAVHHRDAAHIGCMPSTLSPLLTRTFTAT